LVFKIKTTQKIKKQQKAVFGSRYEILLDQKTKITNYKQSKSLTLNQRGKLSSILLATNK